MKHSRKSKSVHRNKRCLTRKQRLSRKKQRQTKRKSRRVGSQHRINQRYRRQHGGEKRKRDISGETSKEDCLALREDSNYAILSKFLCLYRNGYLDEYYQFGQRLIDEGRADAFVAYTKAKYETFSPSTKQDLYLIGVKLQEEAVPDTMHLIAVDGIDKDVVRERVRQFREKYKLKQIRTDKDEEDK